MSLAIGMAFMLGKDYSQSQGFPCQDVTNGILWDNRMSFGCNRDVELAKVPHQLVKQSLLCLFWAALRRQWPWAGGGERLGGGCEGQGDFLVLALFPYSSLGICCGWCQIRTWPSVTILTLLLFLLILQKNNEIWGVQAVPQKSLSSLWLTTQPYVVGCVLKSLKKGQIHHVLCKDLQLWSTLWAKSSLWSSAGTVHFCSHHKASSCWKL